MKEQNKKTYHETMKIENTLRLREALSSLPPFCKEFFRGIRETTETRTQLAYAYDLRVFFDFLHETNPYCNKIEIIDYKITLLDRLNREDIEEYLEYLTVYEKDGKEITNDERGKSRKLASLRTFYKYFYLCEKIEKNIPALVPMPKLHEKEIIRLEPDEVIRLLDLVENGTNLTENQLRFHRKTKKRDLALLTLLLGTGIRVSECVGLDLLDVDFYSNGIKIIRKGGYESVVYFGEEVEFALLDYIEERKKIIPQTGDEDALFLSLQKRRLGVRSIEKLVKKYALNITSLKKITPHKLRSTYGTSLYRETGDIYLVADVLGHKDVNTTKKHYAAQDDANRRRAASIVKLRKKNDKIDNSNESI